MRLNLFYSFFIVLLSLSKGFSQEALTLQESIKAGRSNNLLLQAEQQNIQMAESDIISAKLRPNLQLNNQTLQLADLSRSSDSNAPAGSSVNRQIWWQLTKTFQLPSQRSNKIDIAKRHYEMSKTDFNEVERNLYFAIANKWLDVWVAQKQYDIISIAKSNVDSLVFINGLRYNKQVISETDLLRTKLLADQYALQIKTVERKYQNELKTLKYLTGMHDSVVIDTTSFLIMSMPNNLDSLLNEAYLYRADYLSATQQVDISRANIKLQRAMAYPQPELGAIYNPQNSVPYVGFYGTIDIPVFSRNQGEIKKANYRSSQSEQELEATKRIIETEVTNAFNFYLVQKSNLENYSVILKSSERILSSIRYSYLKGGTTIIDYLEAQRSWLDTRQQYYNTMESFRKAYIQLLYETGYINQLSN